MKKVEANTVVSVKLEPEIKKRLQKIGKIKQRSTHWLMKVAINNYLEVEEHEEQLKQETLRREQEVVDGKVFEHKKVVRWLNSWGTDKETERP